MFSVVPQRLVARGLMPEDRLHPSLQRLCEPGASFSIVKIPDIAEVSEIKRNVLFILSNCLAPFGLYTLLRFL